MSREEGFMRRCLQLAWLGQGSVAPNPMVGCVVVYNDVIIGEGYHELYGGPHAEVNAIGKVKNKELLSQCTLYVSLEPCAHHGKTPPCADLIVQSEIPRVVVACRDSFSLVAGKGIEKLRAAGIEVVENVLHDEAIELNRRFFTFHEKQRPYIILKWAQTSDGFIDRLRAAEDRGINWISGPLVKKRVHQWRAEESAILVGKNTVLNDNSSLTVREVTGKKPIRIILDSHLEIPSSFNIYNDDATTYVFNLVRNERVGVNTHLVRMNESAISPEAICKKLMELKIQSVLIEGGAHVLNSFIDSGLWDESRVIIGDVLFHQGLRAPEMPIAPCKEERVGNDLILYYRH